MRPRVACVGVLDHLAFTSVSRSKPLEVREARTRASSASHRSPRRRRDARSRRYRCQSPRLRVAHPSAVHAGYAAGAHPDMQEHLDALVPARHDRADPLPGRADLHGEDQRGVRELRREGHRADGRRPDRAADQLPDHRQLPGLQADREQARRRLDRCRPPLLQQQRRPLADVRLREDQSPAGLPAAHRRQRARLRALPAHRLRLLSRRAAAAVREGDEIRAGPQLLDRKGAQDHRRADEEHRGRRGRRAQGLREDRPQLRVLRLPPAVGPLLPVPDPGADGLLRPPHRPLEHPGGSAGLAPAGRRGGPGRDGRRARPEGSPDDHADPRADVDHGPNGNGIEGAAANAGYLLSQRGYRIVPPPDGATGNAPHAITTRPRSTGTRA